MYGMICQRSPKPPEFAQPRLSRSNGGRPQREGTHLGVFVRIWLVLTRCEATNLGVFDLCYFALLKRGCANSGVFGARSFLRGGPDKNRGLVGGPLENFNLAWNVQSRREIFNLFHLWALRDADFSHRKPTSQDFWALWVFSCEFRST